MIGVAASSVKLDSLWELINRLPAMGVPFVLLVVTSAYLARYVLSVLPTLVSAYRVEANVVQQEGVHE